MFYDTGPWGLYFKLFTAIINSEAKEAGVFVIVCYFHLTIENTLAYYAAELTTAIISFMVQALVKMARLELLIL